MGQAQPCHPTLGPEGLGGGALATAAEELVTALPAARLLYTFLKLRLFGKQCSVTCPFHGVYSLLNVFQISLKHCKCFRFETLVF